MQRIERRLQDTRAVCSSCAGLTETDPIECISLDCPWLFARKKVERKMDFAIHLRELVSQIEDGIFSADSESDML
jgi:DNA polymerase zeta